MHNSIQFAEPAREINSFLKNIYVDSKINWLTIVGSRSKIVSSKAPKLCSQSKIDSAQSLLKSRHKFDFNDGLHFLN